MRTTFGLRLVSSAGLSFLMPSLCAGELISVRRCFRRLLLVLDVRKLSRKELHF
jgi:hypothetical protein